MSSLLGAEYSDFLSSLYQSPTVGLRVNTLKISPEKFRDLSPYELAPISWCQSGFTIVKDEDLTPPGKHPFHAAGLYYLQEPSAMAAAEALAPQPGEKILDLAAAPGGKTTHLAALMQNAGLLVANEIHPKRVWDLSENLERSGVTNAIITNETPQRLTDHFGEYFDRVLLDAPCSGEGMFRKSQNAQFEWKPDLPNSCAIRQISILDSAARLVKPGGTLAYTTCTFSPEENEGVITNFLSKHPEFLMRPIIALLGLQPSKPEWVGLPRDHEIIHAKRLWPHHSQCEGHFIALMEKTGHSGKVISQRNVQQEVSQRKIPRKAVSQISKRMLDNFSSQFLNFSFDIQQISIVGSYVYQTPVISPNILGLKSVHPGWWLGTIYRDRFKPSHALAMGIKSRDAKYTLPLHIDDPRVDKYLHGDSFSDPGDDGRVLVTLDSFPLGWAKRVNNIVKNYYPHGLRRFT